MEKAKRVFIGGTGRSGTTVLNNLLGRNTDILSFPNESRFIIDPDGLLNLRRFLSSSYTIVDAREAIFRFERLMRVYLTVPSKAPYEGYAFANTFGREFYFDHLDSFLSKITACSYTGSDYHVEPHSLNEGRFVLAGVIAQKIWRTIRNANTHFGQLQLDRPKLKIGKYFEDTSLLNQYCAEYVENLFMHKVEQEGKKTWVEKTPSNLLSILELRDLFPDHLFIHTKRDPRGVVHSYQQQYWAPSRIEDTVELLKQFYSRWAAIKKQADLSQNYIEMKVEDLASDQAKWINVIEGKIGDMTSEYIQPITLDINKVDYWKDTMSKKDRQYVENKLKFAFDLMEYDR